MSTSPRERISPEEYLATERRAEFKSEYYQGETFAMTGASREHVVIAGNITGELRNQFRGRPCEVYQSDMRVRVESAGLYTYPDVVAICGPPNFEDDHVDTLLNPQVIFEILSESTADYDRGRKFEFYRTIESLQEYLLVSQSEPRILHYLREAAHEWKLVEYSDGVFALPTVEARLAFADVYDRIEFRGGP